MSGLTWEEIDELVPRDQFYKRERGQGSIVHATTYIPGVLGSMTPAPLKTDRQLWNGKSGPNFSGILQLPNRVEFCRFLEFPTPATE